MPDVFHDMGLQKDLPNVHLPIEGSGKKMKYSFS
jgi:hypothetical protein